jgi:hypothetical protein
LTIIANNKKKTIVVIPHFTIKLKNSNGMKLVCGFTCKYYLRESDSLLNDSFGGDNLNLAVGMTNRLIVNVRGFPGDVEARNTTVKVPIFVEQLLIRYSRLQFSLPRFSGCWLIVRPYMKNAANFMEFYDQAKVHNSNAYTLTTRSLNQVLVFFLDIMTPKV